MKQTLPDTSHEAWARAKPMISGHHAKILAALQVLGQETAEGIAKFLCMEHSQINRRVSEMERLELIYKPGLKKLTKTGRNAYVWCIRGNNLPKTDNEAHEGNIYKKGVNNAADYAIKLLQATQANLFP